MRFNEILEAMLQPRAAKQQGRISKLVRNIAASDANQAATEMDKVLAMMTYSKLQKATDKNYAKQLKQRLASAKSYLR